MNSPDSNLNEDEISPRLKAVVIGLTVLTILAGIIFLFLVFKRMMTNFSEDPAWGKQMLVVAQKLEADGLKKQAAEQYVKFLNASQPDFKTRASVSLKIAQIFGELNDCPESLIWLYQVEASDPHFPKMQQVRKLISSAKKQCTIQ